MKYLRAKNLNIAKNRQFSDISHNIAKTDTSLSINAKLLISVGEV